jgi:hypothetical protein
VRKLPHTPGIYRPSIEICALDLVVGAKRSFRWILATCPRSKAVKNAAKVLQLQDPYLPGKVLVYRIFRAGNPKFVQLKERKIHAVTIIGNVIDKNHNCKHIEILSVSDWIKSWTSEWKILKNFGVYCWGYTN